MATRTDGDSGDEEFLDCSGASLTGSCHQLENSSSTSFECVIIEDLEVNVNSESDVIQEGASALDDKNVSDQPCGKNDSCQESVDSVSQCGSALNELPLSLTSCYSFSTSSVLSLKACNINQLPSEILLQIFSFFSVFDLFTCIMPVCSRWRRLAQDPGLRKKLVFSFERRVSGDQICELLSGSSQLLTLELQSREDGGELLRQAAASCRKLRIITAKFCDGLSEDVLRALAENCPDIRYFNGEGSRITCTECIAEFRNIRHLNLSHCQFLDNSGLVAIAKQCRFLEYLDIDGITNIYDHAVVCLTREVGNTLRVLYLDGENLTDASYVSLASCKYLKMLGVSFCEQMSDVGLGGIFDLCELTWLKLRKGVHLTSAGLKTLFISGHLGNLTHLHLGECSLMTDPALLAVAETCPRLTNIVLQWCWEVTDIGISALISSCSRLRVLDLVGLVQLTGTCFVNVPTALPDLLILDLEQCNTVDDNILQHIVEENPGITVFDYWGDPVMPPNPKASEDTAEEVNAKATLG